MNPDQRLYLASAKEFVANKQYKYAILHYAMAWEVADSDKARNTITKLVKRYKAMSKEVNNVR